MSSIPTSIGRYDVLGSIGRGGMGSLFLALDPKLDRQIAIKLLRDDDDELRERFAREARAAARLRHPNIVTIFDVGEHDGQPFIAMEYIQGQTLAEVVRGNVAMPLVRKLELMESLCDGLGFAHKGGIVHRDIKPANLMLDADGSLKILDFGIARASEASSMTQAGMLIGTLNYMSPEQVSGQTVDHRSDLFAVGAVFYELVCYRQAFPGGLMAGILNKIISGQPEPLPSIVPDVDAQIVHIVERALEKEPDRRYPDLAAMRQDIMLARMRLAAVEPTRVLGTTPSLDESGDTRFTPPPVRRSSADLEGLARRRTEQIRTNLAEAEQQLAAGNAEGAIGLAEQALLLDGHHGPAHAMIDRARAMIEARQVDAALDAAAGGIASGDFASAGQFLDQASGINPDAPRIAEVRRSLDDAVQRLEETRQREALERRAREALAEAESQFAAGRRDDGVALLAAFRPSHPLVAQALERLRGEASRLAEEERAAAERAAAAAAEAAERERRAAEAERAREREKAATAAIKEAKRAKGPEGALDVLRPALDRDPDNVDLLRAIGANEAELKRAQAKAAEAARRQQEKTERDERDRLAREKAEQQKAERARAEQERAERERRESEAQAAREREKAAAAAAAMAASAEAEADDRTILLKREVPKTPAPAPEPPPAPEPAAPPPPPPAAKAPPPPSSLGEPLRHRSAASESPATGGGVSNAVKYGGAAAAALVVAMLGFVVFGGSPDPEPPPAQPDTTASLGTTEPPPATADVAPVGMEPAPAPEPESPVEPVAPPAATPTPAAPQTTRPAASTALDGQLANLLDEAERRRQGGDNAAALELIESGLKLRAREPRFVALAAQVRQDSERRAGTARTTARGVGQPAISHVTYGEGDALAGQARQHVEAGREIEAARAFRAAETRFNTAALEGRRIVAEQEQAAAAEKTAAATPAAPAAPSAAQEEAAVRQVIDQYRQAYNRLDADAVARVFPSIDVAVIRRGFANISSQTMTFSNVSPTLDAGRTTASVSVQMTHEVQPRAGSRQTNNSRVVFTLRKNGNAWVITDRK